MEFLSEGTFVNIKRTDGEYLPHSLLLYVLPERPTSQLICHSVENDVEVRIIGKRLQQDSGATL